MKIHQEHLVIVQGVNKSKKSGSLKSCFSFDKIVNEIYELTKNYLINSNLNVNIKTQGEVFMTEERV